MGFKDASGQSNQFVASLLKTRGNILSSYDTYSSVDNIADEAHTDGIGYLDPSSVYGMNTLWQIMTDNCNRPLNELIAEIRWEEDTPNMTIYKRVKPFKIRSFDEVAMNTRNTDDNDAKDPRAGTNTAVDFLRTQCSDFKNVRRHKIDKEDVISVNAGTNWRDRFNFVEVNIAKQIMPAYQNKDLMSIVTKESSQFFDHKSIQRDGLVPLRMDINYLPPSAKGEEKIFDINKIFAYKYLGKEWYFDTHKMLNGVITLIGQDRYIQVGDNIMFKADILSSNYNTNLASLNNPTSAYITAHVESIGHRAVVSSNGTRSFITEIQFVRGIVTNENAEKIGTSEQTLDQDTSLVDLSQETNSDRVVGTSSGKDGEQDPDTQKLGHR